VVVGRKDPSLNKEPCVLRNNYKRVKIDYLFFQINKTQSVVFENQKQFKKSRLLIKMAASTVIKEIDLDKYKPFIKSLLKMAKINTEYRDKLTNPASMRVFVQAATHPTADPAHNYEKLEFIGDGIIKAVNSQYIPRRFPNIAKEGDLSKIRRYLEKEKTLAKLAENLGFWEFARADTDTLTKDRVKTLEDMFEAFVGALVQVVDINVKRGLGYNYAYNFLETQLDTLAIDLSTETLDDAVTRLNELYKAGVLKNNKPGLKWGDALYVSEKLFIPRVAELAKAPKTGLKEGQLIFADKERGAFIYTNKGWVNAFYKTPLIEIISPPPSQPLPGGLPDPTVQLIWYAGVFGFLNKTEAFVPINKQNAQRVLDNIDDYGGDLIGQSFAFKAQHAKMNAATNALEYLKRRGIEPKGRPAP